MNAHQALTQARALIVDPAHWTQGSFAKTALGIEVDPHREQGACSFCALGALRSIAGQDYSTYSKASDALYTAAGPHSVVDINDNQGHEAVLALYDRAIEATRA